MLKEKIENLEFEEACDGMLDAERLERISDRYDDLTDAIVFLSGCCSSVADVELLEQWEEERRELERLASRCFGDYVETSYVWII